MTERTSAFVRVTLIAKGLTPPFLWSVLKAARNRQEPEPPPAREAELEAKSTLPEWEYVPEGWARPEGAGTSRPFRERTGTNGRRFSRRPMAQARSACFTRRRSACPCCEMI